MEEEGGEEEGETNDGGDTLLDRYTLIQRKVQESRRLVLA